MPNALLAAGEIGSHTVEHNQIAGRSFGAQFAELSRARADISDWSGQRALGLRPPRELFDERTLEAWRRLGGLYLAAANGATSAAPGVFEVRAGQVVVLPRVVDDDHAIIVMRGRESADSLRAGLQAALDKMRFLGGLDLLTLHSQLIDSERRVRAVESVVLSAREAGDVWIASATDVAFWWLDRSGLDLWARERSDGSVLLSVRNRGRSRVSSAWLRVHLPAGLSTYSAPELKDEILEAELGSDGLRIQLPDLAPDARVDILLPRRPA